jgi:16S rRNA A1518/A1519 N6-dimethyltransferase RsmA/KsgA/DIM1 with predicted DNA glycosylase/AP lyase activity
LRGILRDAPEYRLPSETAEALLSELGVDPSARPETLAPDMFVQLAERLEKPG